MTKSQFKLKNSNARSRSNKILYLVLILIAIVALIGVVYYLKSGNSSEITKDDTAQTESSKEKEVRNSGGSSSESKAPSGVSTVKSEDIPTYSDASIAIISKYQKDSKVGASAKLSGGKNNGKCVFTYTTEGAKPVIKESGISDDTCSVEIPEVEFSKLGAWKLNVAYFSDNKKVEANTDVQIN